MLTIGYSYNTNSADINLHVGAGRIIEHSYVDAWFGHAKNNVQVQADGDELEKIRQQFTNIPMTNNRVVKWNGETAWFIIHNLKL